jgi:hypothetical protein
MEAQMRPNREYRQNSDLGYSLDTLKQILGGEEKFNFYNKALSGDIDALMKCSFMRGLTKEQYAELLKITAECEESEECDED